MAQKPTSLAASLAQKAKEQLAADEQEDAKISRRAAPEGKVWVRLARPCYDNTGVYHGIGIALLPEDCIPSSAKILSDRKEPDEVDETDED